MDYKTDSAGNLELELPAYAKQLELYKKNTAHADERVQKRRSPACAVFIQQAESNFLMR